MQKKCTAYTNKKHNFSSKLNISNIFVKTRLTSSIFTLKANPAVMAALNVDFD